MHIPDGFLGNALSAPLIGAAAVSAGFSISKLKSELLKKKLVKRKKMALAEGDLDSDMEEKWSLTRKGREKLLAMATVGAFIFAAQMMNFPVADGTSGHLIGAALATIVLGPFASILIISVILMVQAVMFGDGGLLALGANIVNMALVASIVSYLVFDKLFGMPGKKGIRFFTGAFVAAWLSVMAAAMFCSFELMLSGQGGMEVLAAMSGVHALIGIGEGLITVLIVSIFFPRLLRS
jgi:cobalt/nickel transport system permease protein